MPANPHGLALEPAAQAFVEAAELLPRHGAEEQLDGSRMAIAGDQMGATIAIATTLATRDQARFRQQVLFCPATAACFDTESYRLCATGYTMRGEQNRWFWDQYCPDHATAGPLAVPIRATDEQLVGLPPALVITAGADCMLDVMRETLAARAALAQAVAALRDALHDALHAPA